MSKWRISGGNRLSGSLKVQGSKNASLPVIAASVLAGCETELINCPEISDIDASVAILRHLGCKVSRDADVLDIDSREITRCDIPRRLMEEMRSSIIFLGSILARCGRAELSMPGGCELGTRPIDIHLEALRALGAQIETEGDVIRCFAPRLRGAEITLRFPSVGATENVMLAACGAEGVTVIENAAKEPEIVDLQKFLRRLGADVSGAGTSRVEIRGFKANQAAGHRIMPDRIVCATYLCAAAAAGGRVTLTDAESEHVRPVIESLRAMGCEIIEKSQSITIVSEGALRACPPVMTGPYPAFPTDAQPLLMAASLKAAGRTVFVETMFENRYRQAQELGKLGGDIKLLGATAVVTGVDALKGAFAQATDLRGGAAVAIAALCAKGETVILDDGHIERGYENLARDLRALGADITRED